MHAIYVHHETKKQAEWEHSKSPDPPDFEKGRRMLANTRNIFSVFNSCSNRPDCIHYRILQLAYEGEWNRFRTHFHRCNNLRNNWKYSELNISITIYGSNHNGFPLEFPIGYWTNGNWAIDNYVFIIKYIWYSRYIYISFRTHWILNYTRQSWDILLW